ncbi:hypothetical protein ABTE35_19215, partial [Acinetobacter baumannii]
LGSHPPEISARAIPELVEVTPAMVMMAWAIVVVVARAMVMVTAMMVMLHLAKIARGGAIRVGHSRVDPRFSPLHCCNGNATDKRG